MAGPRWQFNAHRRPAQGNTLPGGGGGGGSNPDPPPVQTDATWGPNSTFADTWVRTFTPAYNTPATTVVSSWSAMLSALNTASPGDVIETTSLSGMPSESRPTRLQLSRGYAGSAAQNVLMRPPLGSRMSLPNGSLGIDTSYLTVAGYNGGAMWVGDTVVNNTTRRFRSGFWRCTFTYGGMRGPYDDPFMVANVKTQRLVSENDCIQSFAASFFVNRARWEANWVRGNDRPEGSSSHMDTIQWTGSGTGRFVNSLDVNNVYENSSNQNWIQEKISGSISLIGNYFKGAYADYLYPGGSRWGVNGRGNNDNGTALYLTDNQFARDVSFTAKATMQVSYGTKVILRNKLTGDLYVDGTPYHPFTGAVTSAGKKLDTLDPLPNLVGTLWPGECPLAVNLPGAPSGITNSTVFND